jgi:uncharacterized protein with HEPN domain
VNKSNANDILKLNSIIRSITNIKNVFTQHDIESLNIFKNDEIAQAACARFITNIYKAKKHKTNGLQESTYNKLTELNKVKLDTASNTINLDYDSMDFKVIYIICQDLIRASIFAEIYGVLAKLEEQEKSSSKEKTWDDIEEEEPTSEEIAICSEYHAKHG